MSADEGLREALRALKLSGMLDTLRYGADVGFAESSRVLAELGRPGSDADQRWRPARPSGHRWEPAR